MDFAADAVFDAIAPQPRPANARPSPKSGSEPSFDDHLDAVSENEAPAVESSAAENDTPDTDETPSTTDNVTAQPAAAPPQPAPEPSPQFIVQLVAPEAPAAATNTPEAAPADEAGVSAPVSAQPELPHTPQPAPAESGDVALPVTGNAKAQPARAKPESDVPKADAAPTADAPDAAPPAPAQNNAAPVPAPPVTATPISAEATEAIAAIAPQSAPLQPVAKEAAPRTAKIDTRTESQTEATPEPSAAAAQPPAARVAPKSAPSSQGNKDASIQAAAPAIDAPDAPAPTPQPAALSTPAATNTQHATLDHTVTRAAPAAAQVAREIVRQFDGENTRFELRLDPPELGRVEIRLEVSRDHRVTAVIAADSPQALNELAKNARELEQMLQASGLELADSGLSFDLRQGGEGSDTENARSNANGAATSEAPQQQATTARPLGYERWRGVRVDVMV